MSSLKASGTMKEKDLHQDNDHESRIWSIKKKKNIPVTPEKGNLSQG